MEKLIKYWPSIALFALSVTSLGAQETPGNGTILNPLTRPIQVIVKPMGPDSMERQFQIAPGSRLDLLNYRAYDIFVPSERDVYPIDVTRLSSTEGEKHFYAFDFENNKLIIRSGLPSIVFQNASSQAETKALSMRDRWTFRSNDRNSGFSLSPELQRRLQWEWYSGLIYQQTGLEFVILDSWDRTFIVHKGCEENESLTSQGNRIASGLNLGASGNPAKIVRICCQGKKGVSLETIQAIVKSSPRDAKSLPKFTQTSGSGTFDLGEFSGIDNSGSELDLLAQEVRRLNFLLADSRFEFVSTWKQQLTQCLGLQACLLNNQPHLNAEDRLDLSRSLRNRISELYACAFLQSNRSKNLEWTLDGRSLTAITLQCSFSDDGQPTDFRVLAASTMYADTDSYRVEIQFDGIDSLQVRGAGWCMVEKITGTTIPGNWDFVAPGPNTIRWEKADYCVRVNVNQTEKQFDSVFRPLPTQVGDRKWIFSSTGWKSGD